MAMGASAGAPGAHGDDLARLRAIAEEGRARPLLGGLPLIIWGLTIAVAALGHWAVATRLVPVPLWVLAPWWFVLTACAALTAGVAQRGKGDAPGAEAVANRVSRAVWQMGGTFLGTLALGFAIFAAWATSRGAPEAWLLMTAMPPVTFGVYGVALAATAVAGNARWLLPYAWVSLGFTVATAVAIGTIAQFPLMAAGAIVVSILPGLRLLRSDGRG